MTFLQDLSKKKREESISIDSFSLKDLSTSLITFTKPPIDLSSVPKSTLRKSTPQEIKQLEEQRKTQGLNFFEKFVNKITPGFDVFKPDTDVDVREEARADFLRGTGVLKSIPVRKPFGKEGDVVNFPEGGGGAKAKSFLTELAFRIPEIPFSVFAELDQLGQTKAEVDLPFSFSAQRLGQEKDKFVPVSVRFMDRWDELNKDVKSDPLTNGFKAFGTEVVPTMFDFLIVGDIISIGSKTFLKKTRFNPKLDTALNKLGHTRETFVKSTNAQFKEDSVRILQDRMKAGDQAGFRDALESIYIVGGELEGSGILALSKFGRDLQEVARKMVSPLSDIKKVAATRPLGTQRTGLPGFKRKPGQGPAFGFSTEEVERVGGSGLVGKAGTSKNVSSFTKAITSAEKEAIEAAGFSITKFFAEAKNAVDAEIKSITKEFSALAEEARKFNTVDEFIKSQPKSFHGTEAKLTEFDEGVGAFFTDDFFVADGFASGENVFEGFLSFKNPKVIDAKGRKHDDLVNKLGNSTQEIISKVDSTKHDGVVFKNINDNILDDDAVKQLSTVSFAFNPRKSFLNESQLTEIFNASKKTADSKFLKGIEKEVQRGITQKRFSTAQKGKAGERGEVRGAKTQKGIEQRVAKRQVSVEKRERIRAGKKDKLTARENVKEIKALEREKAIQTARTVKKNRDNKLKEYNVNRKARQTEALALVNKLPPALQGRMKQAISEATTSTRVFRLRERVKARLKQYYEAQGVSESDGLVRNAKTAKITPKYQRLIDDLKRDYDFKKPNEKTIKRLKATREFLQRNPDYPIPDKYIEEIRRLEKVNLRDSDLGQIKQFNDTINRLIRIGEEIQKHRTIVNRLKFQRELDKAIEKTVNADTSSHKLNKAKQGENSFQFTFRVADRTDGSQFYKGWHAKLVKEMGININKSEINSIKRMVNFWDEHIKISEITLSEQGQKEVAAHLYADQGGKAQADRILKDLGLDDLPKLTKEQEQIKDLLVKIAKEKTNKIQPLWETTMVDANKRPMSFDVQDKYFPFSYKEQHTDLGIYSILQDYKVQSNIQFGAGQKRLADVKLTPRTDIYKMLQEAVGKQEIYLNIQPQLYEKGTIFRTQKYQDAAGKINSDYWVSYIDEMSRGGMSSNALKTPLDSWLRKGRQNISRGLLDLSVSSAGIQPMAIFDALAYTITFMPKIESIKLLSNFIQSFIRPNFARDTIEKSLALKTRSGGGEEVIKSFEIDKIKGGTKLTKNLWDKISGKIREPFALLKWFDIRTAAAVQKTAVNHLSKILPEEAAVAEADFIMDILSGSSNVAYRPRFMNQGEAANAITTFQTFVLNEWGILTEDILSKGIIKGGPNHDIKTRLWAVLGLGFLFLQGYLEDKVRTNINNFVKGTDYESDSVVKSTLLYIPERLPLIGSVVKGIQYGRGGLPPLASIFTNMLSETVGAVQKKEPKAKLKSLSKAIESFMILALGIPGSKDAQNITERIIEGSDLGERSLEDVRDDILEQLESGQIDVPTAKGILEKAVDKFATKEKKDRLELSNEDFVKDLKERMEGGLSVDDAKEDLVDFVEKKAKEDAKSDRLAQEADDDVGFFSSVWLALRGLKVDPSNVAKAVLTTERLAEVDGKLVKLQRDRGEPYRLEDGSLNPEGSSGLKEELAEKFNIPLSLIPDMRREHILPVGAGGGTEDNNMQLISVELHESYTPLDIAIGKAMRAGDITRRQAEKIMRDLKVEHSITLQEATKRLKELSE